MPDTDKHRHYYTVAPGFLAILLGCLIVVTGAIAASNLPVRGRIDLEQTAKLNNLAMHGVRQEQHHASSQDGPSLDVDYEPYPAAIAGAEAAHLFPRDERTASVRAKNSHLPPVRDRVLTLRAPPAMTAPKAGA